MPLVLVAQPPMDMERMLGQDGSPGSGSGASHQDLIVSSLARRKKGGGPPLPPPPAPRPQPPAPAPAYGHSNAAYASRHEQNR